MFVRSAIAVTVSSAFERVIALAGIAILSRLIAPADIGTFALCGSIITVVGELFNMGFQFALISQSVLTASLIWSHVLLQMAFATALLVVTAAAHPIASHVFGDTSATILIVVAGTRLVIACGATSRVMLERELRFTGLGAVNMVAATVSIVLAVVLARRGYGIWALAVAAGPPSLVGAAIQTAGYLALRPLALRQFQIDIPKLRWYLEYGRTLWMGGQAFALSTQLDTIIVGLMLGPVSLGLYDRAYRVVQAAVAIVNQTFGRVALPLYARLHAVDSESGRQLQEINAGLLLRLFLPVAVLLALGAPELTRLLLGPGWAGTAVLLATLAPYFIFRVLDENLLAYLLGAGFNWARTGGWLIIASISIVALPVSVALIGRVGAPIAVGLATAAGVWWQQHRVGPGSLKRTVHDGMRPLIIAIVAGIAAVFVSRRAPFEGTAEILALKFAMVFLPYMGFLFLLEGAEVRRHLDRFRYARRLAGA